MHPALRQYVERPSPRSAYYVGLGALVGFAGVALALVIAGGVSSARRTRAYEATTERVRAAQPCRSETAGQLALTVVRDYALFAGPRWAAGNPTRACPTAVTALAPYLANPTRAWPTAIAELAPYLAERRELDPWGHACHFRCRALSASSAGPDGIRGTDDDIGTAR